MQPPLQIGTVLQSRYRLLRVLGQGGFGRTYLAADQNRFDEYCVLKELTPPQDTDYAQRKSRELFAREAATLYQLQHPQIPQFYANFEQGGRLFLAQEFVDGPTYEALMHQRKSAHPYACPVFTEPEVQQLIIQLLPVLTYLHQRGIIHRDISPGNLILRDRDRLPVLIDFGVVKETVTQLQGGVIDHATTVGKTGYAPSEQIQTGQVYPNSDLYSLAVTALVLMTGQEPQQLFDNQRMAWNWQRWISVSPPFAQVLDRMLAPRPGDRYQSADEVLQALRQCQVAQPLPPPLTAQPVGGGVATNVATIAVGRPLDDEDDYDRGRHQLRASEPSSDSLLDNPMGVFAIGIIMALLSGLAAWGLVTLFNSRQVVNSPSPTETLPTPTATQTPAPSPTLPSPTSPIAFSQRLELPVGQPRVVEGSLKPDQEFSYLIAAQQGQQLSVSLDAPGVLMTILGPDQKPVAEAARDTRAWQGELPFNGDYAIRLTSLQTDGESRFKLRARLDAVASPSPSPSPSPLPPSPSPSPQPPQIESETLNIAPGENVEVSNQASAGLTRRYLVPIEQGQILRVTVADGAVLLNIRYPNGQLVEDAGRLLTWEAQVPSSGPYQIDVVADQATAFTLRVGVQ